MDCDTATLRRLYLDEHLPLSAIAARYRCSPTTVWRKLLRAGIPTRPGGSSPRYVRRDFSGDPVEKAYLIGFRLGDLHVATEGQTVVVKCTSTRTEQVQLFRALFQSYGHAYTDEGTMERRRRKSVGMEARLNTSFAFLLPKEDCIPGWTLQSDETFFAFFAGYLDPEGYIRTYLPSGYRTPQVRVEVRSYEARVLLQLAEGLNARGILCPAAGVRVPAGYINSYGVRSNAALWGLGVPRKAALLRLFQHIEPHLRHNGRRRDLIKAWGVFSESYPATTIDVLQPGR